MMKKATDYMRAMLVVSPKQKGHLKGGLNIFSANFLGRLMGLEPTTTGITIRDSTN